MQKLTTRQALAAIVAIVEAWEPDGTASLTDAFATRSVLAALEAAGLATEQGALTAAGRALLAEAPRTAERERADVLAEILCGIGSAARMGSSAQTALCALHTLIDGGHHVGAAEARDGR